MENRFSFKKGYEMLPRKKTKRVKSRIKDGLKISSDIGFYNRLNGKVEPKVSEAEIIEAAFIEAGIPKDQIWGE